MYQGFLSHEVVELFIQQKKSFQIVSPQSSPFGLSFNIHFSTGFTHGY
jgi:hypothetical protein